LLTVVVIAWEILSGDCASTRLDPYSGTVPCDSSNPAACQVGDMSGKYGTLTCDVSPTPTPVP